MGADTKIEWCHHTRNPMRGCRKISAGCTNCYAEALARRNPTVLGVWGPNGTRPGTMTEVWSEEFGRWDRAAAAAGEIRRVFVNSMWDPFEGSPGAGAEGRIGPRHDYLEVLDDLAAVAADVPHLRLLLLTKRPWNAVRWWRNRQALRKPFPRWWVLASVENQETADERIPWLLQLPAEVLGLSIEPLLGPVTLRGCVEPDPMRRAAGHLSRARYPLSGAAEWRSLDWVIVGGESGPGARAMDPAWARSLRHECVAWRVPFFMKQMSEHGRADKKAIPEDLMIREVPDAR